jgi:hypothetical protein
MSENTKILKEVNPETVMQDRLVMSDALTPFAYEEMPMPGPDIRIEAFRLTGDHYTLPWAPYIGNGQLKDVYIVHDGSDIDIPKTLDNFSVEIRIR